ncbi:MAG: phosphoserine transaminase [Pseudomonadota bacterium]
MNSLVEPSAVPPKPQAMPVQPSFSSGPCPKFPGWSIDQVVARAQLGRSHRAKGPKAQLKEAIDKTAQILGVPDDYLVGIVPASDTGAFEMAMWSMLGARPVDMLVWESFGAGWASDATKQLKLEDCRILKADYGALPDLCDVRKDADICFTQNGTTSGARIADFDWIPADREGLTFNDATSAAFAQPIDWAKCDVTTFSWQKVMGGEAAHGMLILSPRAVERLESFVPDRPLPKVFRLTKGGKLIKDIFAGATINTPSMLCVADYLTALDWAIANGGGQGMFARADRNAAVLTEWMSGRDWVENLVSAQANQSNTSVCLKITDPAIAALSEEAQAAFAKRIAALLDAEGAAYDIGGYRDAPPGLRVWCGATVEASDLEILTQWLDWAFAAARAEIAAKAA